MLQYEVDVWPPPPIHEVAYAVIFVHAAVTLLPHRHAVVYWDPSRSGDTAAWRVWSFSPPSQELHTRTWIIYVGGSHVERIFRLLNALVFFRRETIEIECVSFLAGCSDESVPQNFTGGAVPSFAEMIR